MEGDDQLLVSAIQIYEVFKFLRRELSDERATEAVSAMRAATVVDVTESIAIDGAALSLEFGLGMADAVIYATARRYGASIVTMDADFERVPEATVIR